MSDETLRAWSRFVSALPAVAPWIREGVALESCGSTQDECWARSGGVPGLLVASLDQRAARGQFGRPWRQTPGRSVAFTAGLDAAAFSPARLSLAAGVAAARAVRAWTEGDAAATVGLKWPNDVLADHPASGTPRKIAGVLVEVRDGLALLGIGINVGQRTEEFPPELRDVAASIGQLSGSGPPGSTLDVMGTVITELTAMLRAGEDELASHWLEFDLLTGTEQTFVHDGRRYRGTVEAIDPMRTITLRTGAGPVSLPAATTRLSKDVGGVARRDGLSEVGP